MGIKSKHPQNCTGNITKQPLLSIPSTCRIFCVHLHATTHFGSREQTVVKMTGFSWELQQSDWDMESGRVCKMVWNWCEVKSTDVGDNQIPDWPAPTHQLRLSAPERSGTPQDKICSAHVNCLIVIASINNSIEALCCPHSFWGSHQ